MFHKLSIMKSLAAVTYLLCSVKFLFVYATSYHDGCITLDYDGLDYRYEGFAVGFLKNTYETDPSKMHEAIWDHYMDIWDVLEVGDVEDQKIMAFHKEYDNGKEVNKTDRIFGKHKSRSNFILAGLAYIIPEEEGEYTFSLEHVSPNSAAILTFFDDDDYYCCENDDPMSYVRNGTQAWNVPSSGDDSHKHLTVSLKKGEFRVMRFVYMNGMDDASFNMTMTFPNGTVLTDFSGVLGRLYHADCGAAFPHVTITETTTVLERTTTATSYSAYEVEDEKYGEIYVFATTYYVAVPGETKTEPLTSEVPMTTSVVPSEIPMTTSTVPSSLESSSEFSTSIISSTIIVSASSSESATLDETSQTFEPTQSTLTSVTSSDNNWEPSKASSESASRVKSDDFSSMVPSTSIYSTNDPSGGISSTRLTSETSGLSIDTILSQTVGDTSDASQMTSHFSVASSAVNSQSQQSDFFVTSSESTSSGSAFTVATSFTNSDNLEDVPASKSNTSKSINSSTDMSSSGETTDTATSTVVETSTDVVSDSNETSEYVTSSSIVSSTSESVEGTSVSVVSSGVTESSSEISSSIVESSISSSDATTEVTASISTSSSYDAITSSDESSITEPSSRSAVSTINSSTFDSLSTSNTKQSSSMQSDSSLSSGGISS